MESMYIGVDGCSDGWIAVWYDTTGYVDSGLYPTIGDLWDDHGNSADTILIDVPIGLRESSAKKRPCDDDARQKLSPNRHSSVFPVPVRAAVHEDCYEEAKSTQEERTDSSLGVQSWHISNLIAQLDTFLLETTPDAIGTIREAHPEICFWALNEKTATTYSKTQQPAAAFWERIGILESIDASITANVREAATGLNADVGNDDFIDAFALALTASPKTGNFHTLPEEWPNNDPGDPTNKLPMEMVYAYP